MQVTVGGSLCLFVCLFLSFFLSFLFFFFFFWDGSKWTRVDFELEGSAAGIWTVHKQLDGPGASL